MLVSSSQKGPSPREQFILSHGCGVVSDHVGSQLGHDVDNGNVGERDTSQTASTYICGSELRAGRLR